MKTVLAMLLVCAVMLTGCASIAPARILIQWTTASEVNTAGFNLYRSQDSEGPYTKINAQLIPASNDALTGAKYEYEDTDVVYGRTYYYQLEDVELSGTSTRHGPIIITASAALPGDPTGILLALCLAALVGLGAVLYTSRRFRKSNAG